MKIHIDFVHLPNVNFFKNLIRILENNGHEIILTAQKRGRLPQILEKELPNYNIKAFGKHRGTLFSIIFESNFFRFFKMFLFVLKNRPDLGLNVGSFPQEISMGLLRIPNITISDDPERKYDFFFHNIFATNVLFPPIIKKTGKYKTFNALKEWAYLSPKYFEPNSKTLDYYNVKEKEYIFIREVSTGSMNYLSQESGLILSFANLFPKDIKVLFSLEDKSKVNLYPKSWTLLQEPIEDIHSLLYYSKIVISSGDSMAREGAMLGVSSVYCGIREMKANDIMIKSKSLHKVDSKDVLDFINNKYYDENDCLNQDIFREKLMADWDDVNAFVIDIINERIK